MQQHLQAVAYASDNMLQQHSTINNLSAATSSNGITLDTEFGTASSSSADAGTSSSSPPSPALTTSSCTSSSSCSSASASSSPPSIGVNLRVTGQCSQGGRKYMEDYFSVAYQQSENGRDLEYAFIGIYDGHGGAEAATFAKEHLMLEIINQKLFWSDLDQDVLRAIREGYIATHFAMWRDQDKWPKTANGLPSTAGTTATIAFIRREKIYIGHVGDSGIVLGYQNEHEEFWRAAQLTTDHKPESLAERTRIIRAGGKVVVKSGVPRVVWNRPRSAGHRGPIRRNTPVDEIPFLAVARSLGDLWSYNSARNEFIVSPDPDVKVIKINPKTFRCLIFGTDGLWNVVTAQEAVDTVHEKETINERLQAQRVENPSEGAAQWTNPSKGLVERALKTWSAKKMRADNTSVVTVILYPPGNGSELGAATAADDCAMHSGQTIEPIYGEECAQEASIAAAIPAYEFDDATTFHEMAEKYLPPEEYRNFNYYDDDTEGADLLMMRAYATEEDADYGTMMAKCQRGGGGGHMHWRHAFERVQITPHATSNANDAWRWTDSGCPYTERMAGIETVEDHDDDDDEDDDDVEEDDDDEETDGAGSRAAKAAGAAIIGSYEQYNSNSSYLTCTTGGSGGGGFLNSFAESYNSLLSEQMAQEASTSKSNAAYQSITGSNMHELLQEQQLYQQQCMSEEEGYSLTKLETRREQQRCSAVQTFKIFQQHHDGASADATYLPASGASTPSCVPSYWSGARYHQLAATSGARYHNYQQQQQQQQQTGPQQQSQKPLELNSLLQQEREEEQQVAFEQMELQRKMADGTATSSCGIVSAQTQSEPVSCADEDAADDDADESLVEEYLDEEEDVDSAVQINEISSSSAGDVAPPTPPPDLLLMVGAVSHTMRRAPRMLSPAYAQSPTNSRTPPPSPQPLIETIEKIEILRDKPELVIETSVKSRPAGTSRRPAAVAQPMPAAVFVPALPRAAGTVKRSVQMHYPNIPNENQNQRSSVAGTGTAAATLLHSRCRYGTATSTAVAALEKRQLRSSSNNSGVTDSGLSATSCHLLVMDYSKRTLRTRNSLAKDMKAKTSLTATLRRTASVAATQYLRTNAVALLAGHQNSASGGVGGVGAATSNNSGRGRRGSTQRSRQELQQQQPSINLRSRQPTPAKSAPSVSAPPPPAILQRVRRNLRSTLSVRNMGSGKETAVTSSANHTALHTTAAAVTTTNFSKSTRLQAVVQQMSMTPPSPKVMNAASGTRARSLLGAKNAAAASVASTSAFSKRAALRSGRSATATNLPLHSTRNRAVSKNKMKQ